jgi:asparagine synthase (glutamine-hydrolysing)
MCGICGYINLEGRPISDDGVLKEMTRALTHRGPDDEGFFIDANAALGHRRLSIIDLEKGHQPLFNEDGSLAIVYNGEIYNFPELKAELVNKGYAFRTNSDTEVLLKSYEAFGAGCLGKLNGMFALAIWDKKTKSLFLARDRFGKKPLYYGVFDNTFLFASELKSIFRNPKIRVEIDRLALAKYFSYDYIPAPGTILKNVHKLEAGHYLVLKNGGLNKYRYWDFTFKPDRLKPRDFEEGKHTLSMLLRESVRKRLISDVPLGVFLSGGIDSSAVVAMMSTLMEPKDIKTFSIGFGDKTYNEADSAMLVARHFKTDHYEKILTPDMMLDIIPRVMDIIDEPFADSSIIPTHMVSRFAREHVKVALGGDGGDELLMGYMSFVAHRIAGYYDKVPGPGKKLVKFFADKIPGKSDYNSLYSKFYRFLRGFEYAQGARHQVWIGSLTPAEQKPLFLDNELEEYFDPTNIYDESDAYFNAYPELPHIDKVEYIYIKTYLTDDILAKVDRASMATGLEVRAPFLDKDVAEFTGSMPNNFKLNGHRTKFILKEAMKGILPGEILRKRKHGFAVPVGSWFRSELKGLLLETFEKKKIEKEKIFRYSYIESLLKEHFSGKKDNSRLIWALFVFETWYNKWVIR